jgi:molybdopterin converting factor small subunit
MTGAKILVRYWGAVAVKLKRKTETLQFPVPPDMRALLGRIAGEASPEGREALQQPGLLLAANGRAVGPGHRLADGDAVDIVTPVSGG